MPIVLLWRIPFWQIRTLVFSFLFLFNSPLVGTHSFSDRASLFLDLGKPEKALHSINQAISIRKVHFYFRLFLLFLILRQLLSF